MENERENTRDQSEDSGRQQPLGQQSQEPQGQQQGQRPLGEQGDFGTQEAGLSDESTGQASEQHGETATLGEDRQPDLDNAPQAGESGFVGSQGEDSGEYLQQGGNPETGFAEQGQGASEQGDVERDKERSENRESDIEGSSGN